MSHPCDECGSTIPECDERIREHGQGCCDMCFAKDTHGLLDRYKPADQAQEIENLNRLVAQMVIARSEHAKAIRQARADVDSLTVEIALLRGRLTEADRTVRHDLMLEVMTDVRRAVQELPERVEIIERALPEIERRVGLKRKAAAFTPHPPFKKTEEP